MKIKALSQQKLAAIAGMVGAALFVTIFTLDGWLRPGYDPRAMFVSALSLGPRGWLQIANFIIFGVLLLLFTRGVAVEFHDARTKRIGVILLATIASCYLLSGIFVMDPTGTPPSQSTLHGMLHGIIGGVVFLLMPISCFAFLKAFRTVPKWQSFHGWSLVLGTIDAIAVIVFTIASKSPQAQGMFADWNGLIQRAAIIPFMLWIFLFALKLYPNDG